MLNAAKKFVNVRYHMTQCSCLQRHIFVGPLTAIVATRSGLIKDLCLERQVKKVLLVKLDKAFDPTFQHLVFIGNFLAGSILCFYGSIFLGKLGLAV